MSAATEVTPAPASVTAATAPAPSATETKAPSTERPTTAGPRSRKPRRRAPKPKTAEDGTAASTQQEEEDNTYKVFVGNLAFATTEEELKQFGSPAGDVVKVEIILRGTRSLGYGFISYNTEEESIEAVSLLDKKELGGRQVNVESAKLRKAGEPKPFPVRGRRGRGRGFLGRGRVRTTEKRVDDENTENKENSEGKTDGEVTSAPSTHHARRGRRFPKGTRAPRVKVERSEISGDLSETGLFVANLPFKVTDDDLKAIFKDYQVTKARVVRLRSGRSKGFGFVEVESKVEQSRIINELKNVVVEGRELVIKVALANQTAPESGAEETAVAAA